MWHNGCQWEGLDIMARRGRSHRPGIAGIVVGIVLMVCGPVLGVGIIVYSSNHSVAEVGSGQTSTSDTTPVRISLVSGSTTGVWITHGGHGSCQVYDPQYVPIPLVTRGFIPMSVSEYDLGGTFTPPVDGVYTINCSSSSGSFTFKVAPLKSAGLTVGTIAGVVVICVVFIVGLVLLIAMWVRRYGWHENDKPHRSMISPSPDMIAAEPDQFSSMSDPPSTETNQLSIMFDQPPTEPDQPIQPEAVPPEQPFDQPEAVPPEQPSEQPEAVPPESPHPQVWPPTYTSEPPEDWGHPQSPYGDGPSEVV